MLQWGHDFSAVEISSTWWSPGSRTICFNGATTFQPWKSSAATASSDCNNPASMGPRLFSRGNGLCGPVNEHAYRELQWGHDFSAVEMPPSGYISGIESCFNGATTFQPWKWHLTPYSSYLRHALQWGHDFSAVEISRENRRELARVYASMGPRLFSRGNDNGDPMTLVALLSFNGATTFPPWKFVDYDEGTGSDS